MATLLLDDNMSVLEENDESISEGEPSGKTGFWLFVFILTGSRADKISRFLATFTEDKPLHPVIAQVLKLLHAVRLLRLETDAKGQVVSTTNLTLINLWLVWRGPLREDRLATELLLLQTVVGAIALIARHMLGAYLFTLDNRF